MASLMCIHAPQKSEIPKLKGAKESKHQTERQTSMTIIILATANHLRSPLNKTVNMPPLRRTTVNVELVHLNANL